MRIYEHTPKRRGALPARRRRQRQHRPSGRTATALLCIALVLGSGCHASREFHFFGGGTLDYVQPIATSLDVPNVPIGEPPEVIGSLPPRTLIDEAETQYWDMTLEEAVQIALATNEVMRDLGGRVVDNPAFLTSIYDPAIQEANPLFGIQGAMSAFDARLTNDLFWARNDRVFNNLLLGGGVHEFQQDRGVMRTEVSKRAATGTQFAMRQNVDYDWNNAPFNLFPSAWNVNYEAEVRQPFGRGGGLDFNRIAGPFALPGSFFRNGILLARVDNDVSITDFEAGVRNLVNDVENAYWDLYYAYRDLDAKIAARDSALATWRHVQRLAEAGQVGGEAGNVAEAAEQYFLFRAEVENALAGRPAGSTQQGVGTRTGTFLATGGLYAREANLRLLLGLPNNDGRLIRPVNEPTTARLIVDWDLAMAEALVRRVELRRQRWRIKRRELELIAQRNFLKPTLDGVALYRWRGFGNDLIEPNSSGRPPFDNAFQNLTGGNYQEWQMGIQLDVPIGFREGHAAVRYAQLNLARERAVLREQERHVAHDLAAAVREVNRAYTVSQTHFNRLLRARDRVTAVQHEYEAGEVTLDRVLDAQRNLAGAETAYFRSLVEYNVAIKAVHFEQGTLLDYNSVYLAEGPWPAKAYVDAERVARRAREMPLDFRMTVPRPVSLGEYSQEPGRLVPGADAVPIEEIPIGRPAGGSQPGADDSSAPPGDARPESVPAQGADMATAPSRPAEPTVRPASGSGPLTGGAATALQPGDMPPAEREMTRPSRDEFVPRPAGEAPPDVWIDYGPLEDTAARNSTGAPRFSSPVIRTMISPAPQRLPQDEAKPAAAQQVYELPRRVQPAPVAARPADVREAQPASAVVPLPRGPREAPAVQPANVDPMPQPGQLR